MIIFCSTCMGQKVIYGLFSCFMITLLFLWESPAPNFFLLQFIFFLVVQEAPDEVFLIEDCPHDWLFPQCAAVVHHGGAGTTATGVRAGCPTTIIPFFGDQFFWGDRIHEKGLGPSPIPISQLNVEHLSNAIRFMLAPEVKLRVMELANMIVNEDGVRDAVDAFHRHLPPELPIPHPTLDAQPMDPFEWLLTFIKKWCCFPWES
uniref:Sterol 3-beta-glucosyltransferase n=1 Tax=Anthurium amnicola TaxID=1678845 RepID=A0A1D1Z4J3_9ARAE